MRFLWLTTLSLLTCAFMLGCSGDKERGINSGRDRPKAADKAE